MANPRATVFRAGIGQLLAWMDTHPGVAHRLQKRITLIRNDFLSQQEPTRRLIQDFYLRHGYDGGGLARVGQTDLCLDCKKCEEACSKRHGVARVSRNGPRLGILLFHQVCRECPEHPCLSGCKVGAIALSARGRVVIDHRCTGCGICARKCPHGAIFLVDADQRAKHPSGIPAPGQGASRKRRVAVKCDRCEGREDMACFRACPTGALAELPARLLFKDHRSTPVEGREGNFTGVPFLEGVREHQSRAKPGPWYLLLSVVLVFALFAIGIENFLRRFMPEHSVSHALYSFLGWTDSITFSSGKGLGHWQGYIGTAFMLLTAFYPLRTRLGVFRNWGSQSDWLSFHLWVGFIGATLVTYHSAFKLDRWVGLSCISMWIVIISGAIGRYLYGLVHSGIGLVDLEESAMKHHSEIVAQQRTASTAVRALTREFDAPAHHRGILAVMLWLELRDAAVMFWLRRFGLTTIQDPALRKQTLRFLADWTENRRNRHYLESAKRMLQHWNWVHIVLAIVMFALAGVHITYGLLYKAV